LQSQPLRIPCRDHSCPDAILRFLHAHDRCGHRILLAFVTGVPLHTSAMKTNLRIAAFVLSCLTSASLCAQPAPRGGGMSPPTPGPRMSGSMQKLFGEHSAFSADLEMQSQSDGAGNPTTIPGKIACLEGKSRFEMEMSRIKGAGMPPEAAEQMKAMGMDSMVVITRPDKKITYLIYPGLQSFAEMALQDPDAARPDSDFKVETTELAKEAVDGKACVKNKVVVTDKEGNKHESTVWNATDQKKFPIKIETTERGNPVVRLFRDIKLAKPESSLFEPPASYTKYDNVMTMMQQEMMKRMGAGQR